MSGFLETLQTGTRRVVFEVDKTLRVLKARSELSSLRKGLEICYRNVGQEFYDLYTAGEIDHEQMANVCAQTAEQLQQIDDKEGLIESIRAEAFVVPVPSPALVHASPTIVNTAPTAVYTPSIEQVETLDATEVSAESAVSSPSVTGSSPDATEVTKYCLNCSIDVPLEAVFCPRCGSRLPDVN